MSFKLVLYVLALTISFEGAFSRECRRELRVGGFAIPPYLNLRERDSDNLPTGVEMQVLKMITDKLDYCFNFTDARPYRTLKKTYGRRKGPFNMILANLSDVGIGQLDFSHEHLDLFDLSMPVYLSKWIVMSQKSSALPQLLNFVKPFSPLTWKFIAVSGVLACFLQPLFLSQAGQYISGVSFKAWLTIVGFMLHQGQRWCQYKRLSAVTFAIFWMFFSTFIWMLYEADLRSYLISTDYDKVVDTVADALQMQAPLFCIPNRLVFRFMSNSPVPDHRQLIENSLEKGIRLFEDGNALPTLESMRSMRETRGIIVFPQKSFPIFGLHFQKAFRFNSLRMGKEVVFAFHYGIAFRKGSGLKVDFDNVLIHLFSAGLIDKPFSDNLPIFVDDDHMFGINNDEDNAVLSLDHFGISLIILALGLLISLLLFAGEIKAKCGK